MRAILVGKRSGKTIDAIEHFMHDLRARERGLETELHYERQKVAALLKERGALRGRVLEEIEMVRVATEQLRQDGPNLKRKRERAVSAGAAAGAIAVCDRIEPIFNPPREDSTDGSR